MEIAFGDYRLCECEASELDSSAVQQLSIITAQGFRHSTVTDALIADVVDHIERAQRLFLLKDESEGILGFICLALIDFPHEGRSLSVLHIQGMVHSVNGYGSLVMQELVSVYKADVMAFHTTAEPMARLGKVNGAVYDPVLALSMAETLGTKLEELRLIYDQQGTLLAVVEQGRYKGQLYGELLGGYRVPFIDDQGELRGDACVYTYLNCNL